MISFSEYSESVSSTKRKGISHLQDMKPEEFVSWIKKIKQAGGILSDYKTTMKVDGLGARFGKAEDGRVFFEGSRTGPIFDSGAFSTFARSRGSSDEIVLRATHYDNMLEFFKGSKLAFDLPKNTKVICEIFYNPMANEDETGITFVTVKYDKKKLGSLMTIIPYNIVLASDGSDHPEKGSILQNLYNNSNDKIKVISPDLKMKSIDINGIVDTVATLDTSSLSLLASRKSSDKEAKINLLSVIQQAKNELADYILDHPNIEDKFKLGPQIEGIVLHLDNAPYKITTKEFKDSKKK